MEGKYGNKNCNEVGVRPACRLRNNCPRLPLCWMAALKLFVLNCLVLIIVVLLQSGKAADLAGAFGGAGSQTAFGPRGAANVLSKATTWCAVMFMLCAMAMVLRTDKAVGQGSSILEKVSKPAPKPAPVAPATTPTTSPVTPPVTSQP